MGIRWLASAFEAAMFYGEAARGARAPPGDGEGNQGAEPIIALVRGIAEWRRIRFNEHNEQRELAAENRCVKRTTHPIPLSWSQGRMYYMTWTRDTLPATRRGPRDCRIRIGEGAGGDADCYCKQQKIESIISNRTGVDGSVGSS